VQEPLLIHDTQQVHLQKWSKNLLITFRQTWAKPNDARMFAK
jgi:hypothetical protein